MPQIYANEYSYYDHISFRGYIVMPPTSSMLTIFDVTSTAKPIE